MGALTGKAVVITGSGRGLGEAFAKLAAAEGASVVVNALDADQTERVAASIRGKGGKAVNCPADVSCWSGAERLVETCLAEFGSLDGFVNNAAMFHMASIADETEQSIRRSFEVNALGTAFCGTVALRQMVRQGQGSLVNIVSGAQAGIFAMSTYGGTKGAAASLTYGWAVETANTGVRVNAVSPIATTRTSTAMADFSRQRGCDAAINISPESNAPPVVFLLSDAASQINGQIIRIQDGDLSLMTHPAIREPGLQDPDWTIDKVARAFAEDLGERQLPLGVQGYRVELGNYSVPYLPKMVAHS